MVRVGGCGVAPVAGAWHRETQRDEHQKLMVGCWVEHTPQMHVTRMTGTQHRADKRRGGGDGRGMGDTTTTH